MGWFLIKFFWSGLLHLHLYRCLNSTFFFVPKQRNMRIFSNKLAILEIPCRMPCTHLHTHRRTKTCPCGWRGKDRDRDADAETNAEMKQKSHSVTKNESMTRHHARQGIPKKHNRTIYFFRQSKKVAWYVGQTFPQRPTQICSIWTE